MARTNRGNAGIGSDSNRGTGSFEAAALSVLSKAREPMSISALSQQILKQGLVSVRGKTPERSLYSIILRGEQRREQAGEKRLFRRIQDGRKVFYTVNRK